MDFDIRIPTISGKVEFRLWAWPALDTDEDEWIDRISVYLRPSVV